MKNFKKRLENKYTTLPNNIISDSFKALNLDAETLAKVSSLNLQFFEPSFRRRVEVWLTGGVWDHELPAGEDSIVGIRLSDTSPKREFEFAGYFKPDDSMWRFAYSSTDNA